MRILEALLFCVASLPLMATPPMPAMNPGQKSVYTKLCQEVVAPCCWTQTLTSHQSGAADEVRVRIANGIVAGKTPEQIRADLVAEYGERILAFKSADQQAMVLFAVPVVVLIAGGFLLAFYLRRMRRRPQLAPSTGTAAPPFNDEDWD